MRALNKKHWPYVIHIRIDSIYHHNELVRKIDGACDWCHATLSHKDWWYWYEEKIHSHVFTFRDGPTAMMFKLKWI